jgi:hypothetical protein
MGGSASHDAHDVQDQVKPPPGGPVAAGTPATTFLRLQRSAGNRAVGRLLARRRGRSPLRLARQTLAEELTAKDPWAGTLVQQIVISLARERVGFQTRVGMILGNVTTDLKPGSYKLKLEADKKRWLITEPAVKTGWRFEVSLEGADPWTLAYPEEIPLLVVAGSLEKPNTFADVLDAEGNLKDPLWLHEGLPPELKPKPIAGVDDFESAHYDIDYRSEGGNLSKWIVLNYRDGTTREINIDTIADSTPKLAAAKKDVLKIMDDYNALFILGAFPTVFFILTMAPTVAAPGKPGGYTVRRIQVPKSRGGTAPKGEPGGTPKSEPGGGKPSGGATADAPGFTAQQQKAQELAGVIAGKGEKVVVNIGGAGARHEPQAAINVNNQAVARKDIPNLVQADGSRVGELFKPGSVDRIEGHNMAPGAVDWTKAAPGAYKVLKPGGTLQYYYRGANADAQAAERALTQAGFKDVKNASDVLITATKPGG